MKRTTCIAALVGCVLLVAAGSADASLAINFNVGYLQLNYATVGQSLTINSVKKSEIDTTVYDTKLGTQDFAELDPSDSSNLNNWLMNLTLTRLGTNDWQASGVWTLNDRNGQVVKANFVSTFVGTLQDASSFGAEPGFVMKGVLTPFSTDPGIMVKGSVVGDNDSSDYYTGVDGKTDNQITLPGWQQFSNGTLVTINFLTTAYADTDTFLSTNEGLGNGTGSATLVPVPVPAAFVLGLVGLSLIGWRMRKYA
jgi:hypothetical protein